jgi:hypothetical protein
MSNMSTVSRELGACATILVATIASLGHCVFTVSLRALTTTTTTTPSGGIVVVRRLP